MRIDVSDRALVAELLEFLRSCSCTAERTGPGSIRVSLDSTVLVGAALSLVQAGVCYACTQPVEAPLARLGSALCLGCRDSRGGRTGGPQADAAARRRWARMAVEAYLRVWETRHPQVRATLSEPGPDALAATAR